MSEQYQNFGLGTITTTISAATNPCTVVLTPGQGANFPSTYPYRITLSTGAPNTAVEVMIVTTATTDSLTAYRGTAIATYGAVEVPTPTLQGWGVGSVVSHNLTVGAMNQIRADLLAQVYGDYSVITVPTTSGFPSQFVSAAATNVTFTNDTSGGFTGVILQGSSTTNDTNLVTRVYAVPSIPYSLRMRFWPTSGFNQYALCGGIALYNSTNTNFIVYGGFSRGQAPSNGPQIRIAQFSNASTFSSSPIEEMAWGFPGRAGLCDIQIVDNGTNRLYYLIGDGCVANRVQIYTETNTQFLVPTHVGIFIAPGNNQTPHNPVRMKVIDWTQGTS